MTLSPTFTSIGMRCPSSNRPGPTAMTSPSWGFSLAVSGITMPETVVCSSSLGCTAMRSSSGFSPNVLPMCGPSLVPRCADPRVRMLRGRQRPVMPAEVASGAQCDRSLSAGPRPGSMTPRNRDNRCVADSRHRRVDLRDRPDREPCRPSSYLLDSRGAKGRWAREPVGHESVARREGQAACLLIRSISGEAPGETGERVRPGVEGGSGGLYELWPRRARDLPDGPRRHRGQDPRPHPRGGRLRHEAVQPGGGGGPHPGRPPPDWRLPRGGRLEAPVRGPGDGRGLARGPPGRGRDRAPPHRVQPAPVPVAEPEAGAVAERTGGCDVHGGPLQVHPRGSHRAGHRAAERRRRNGTPARRGPYLRTGWEAWEGGGRARSRA